MEPLAAFGLALLVLAIALGVLATMSERDRRRRVRALEEALCPSCRQPFGTVAAESAPRDLAALLEAARREHPNLRIYFGHRWPVCCGGCATKAWFDYDTGIVTPADSK